MQKVRESTRVDLDKFGRERTVKISELCQYCPNNNCVGFYRRDAPRACLTFYSWKAGEISLEQAINVKYKQNKRHRETDRFRDEIYSVLEHYTFDYESRVIAGGIASDLVKGIPLDEALDEFPVSKEDKEKIELILKEMNAYQQKSEVQNAEVG